jgi:hypothetical protein
MAETAGLVGQATGGGGSNTGPDRFAEGGELADAPESQGYEIETEGGSSVNLTDEEANALVLGQSDPSDVLDEGQTPEDLRDTDLAERLDPDSTGRGELPTGSPDTVQGPVTAGTAAVDLGEAAAGVGAGLIDFGTDAAGDALDPITPRWLEWLLNNQEVVVAGVVVLLALAATNGTVGTPGGS